MSFFILYFLSLRNKYLILYEIKNHKHHLSAPRVPLLSILISFLPPNIIKLVVHLRSQFIHYFNVDNGFFISHSSQTHLLVFLVIIYLKGEIFLKQIFFATASQHSHTFHSLISVQFSVLPHLYTYIHLIPATVPNVCIRLSSKFNNLSLAQTIFLPFSLLYTYG